MIIEKPDPQDQLAFLEKAYSEWKWAVFPLHKIKRNFNLSKMWCGCHKGHTCTSIGKHPAIKWSERDQYPDRKEIYRLVLDGFTSWGVHLGWSGIICADLDPRAGADAKTFVRDWRYDRGIPILATHTGSGGVHFFFPDCGKCDPIKGFSLGIAGWSTSIPFGPGDDLFGGKHYCVLPFSPHKSGRIYTVFTPPKDVNWERIADHDRLDSGNMELGRERWKPQDDGD